MYDLLFEVKMIDRPTRGIRKDMRTWHFQCCQSVATIHYQSRLITVSIRWTIQNFPLIVGCPSRTNGSRNLVTLSLDLIGGNAPKAATCPGEAIHYICLIPSTTEGCLNTVIHNLRPDLVAVLNTENLDILCIALGAYCSRYWI